MCTRLPRTCKYVFTDYVPNMCARLPRAFPRRPHAFPVQLYILRRPRPPCHAPLSHAPQCLPLPCPAVNSMAPSTSCLPCPTVHSMAPSTSALPCPAVPPSPVADSHRGSPVPCGPLRTCLGRALSGAADSGAASCRLAGDRYSMRQGGVSSVVCACPHERWVVSDTREGLKGKDSCQARSQDHTREGLKTEKGSGRTRTADRLTPAPPPAPRRLAAAAPSRRMPTAQKGGGCWGQRGGRESRARAHAPSRASWAPTPNQG